MIYEYKCRGCGARQELLQRHPHGFDTYCTVCSTTTHWGRVYSLAIKPMMHEHFNHAVGRTISDMGQFRDALKVASEHAYDATGIEHRFVPNEGPESVGATGEGIYESNVQRSRRGEPLLPEIDSI